MSSSRRKMKNRVQRPEEIDLDAEIARLVKQGLDEEYARIIAEQRVERAKLGMTKEQYREYCELRDAEQAAREQAEREAAKKAEEEAAAAEPAPWDVDEEEDDEPSPQPRRAAKAVKKKARRNKVKSTEEPDDWKDGYAAVPYPVIDKLLHAMHPGLLRVYLGLLRFESYAKGTMYPGQERIAKLAGLADRQTRKYLHALRDVGLITIKRQGYFKGRENMPNLYQHVPVTRENCDEILAKLEAFSLPGMTKADRKRLSGTDRHR